MCQKVRAGVPFYQYFGVKWPSTYVSGFLSNLRYNYSIEYPVLLELPGFFHILRLSSLEQKRPLASLGAAGPLALALDTQAPHI